MDWAGRSVTVHSIDPKTGTQGDIASFELPDDATISEYASKKDMTSVAVRQLFSPDFSRLAVTKSNTAGAGASTSLVGWIDQSGQFTNVTAMSGSADGFQSATVDDQPAFSADGNFWFLRGQVDSDRGTIVDGTQEAYNLVSGSKAPAKVAFSNLPSGARPHWNFSAYSGGVVRTETGGNDTWSVFPGKTVGCFGAYDTSTNGRCSMAIDSSIYLLKGYASADEESRLMMSEALSASGVFINEGADILPPNNLSVDDPVFDPTGEIVAFKSSDPTGASTYNLFTVPMTGKSPQKVPGVQLGKDDQLIGWIA